MYLRYKYIIRDISLLLQS